MQLLAGRELQFGLVFVSDGDGDGGGAGGSRGEGNVAVCGFEAGMLCSSS